MTDEIIITLTPEQVASVIAQSGTPVPPEPPPISTRHVYGGYFGCDDAQVAETADHVSMHFEPFWGGLDVGIARIKQANLPTVVVVSDELFHGNQYLGAAKSQAALRNKFNRMEDAGALNNVLAIFTIDEPDVVGISEHDIRIAQQYLRWVMEQYPMLVNRPLWINYGMREDYRAIDDTNWASFDDYGARDSIFTNGKYDRFKSYLRPEQRAALVPGGCDSNDGSLWRANPGPFVSKAQEDKQVIAILAFIWLDHWGGTQSLGIHSNGLAPSYRAALNALKGIT